MSDTKNIDYIIKKENELKELNKKKQELDGEINSFRHSYAYSSIYENILRECEHFKLKLTYSLGHGFSIYLNDKTSEYRVYNLFSSYSWFNEWFEKLYNSTDLIDLRPYSKQVEEDFTKYDKVVKELETVFERPFTQARLDRFYKYITEEIKFILDWSR